MTKLSKKREKIYSIILKTFSSLVEVSFCEIYPTCCNVDRNIRYKKYLGVLGMKNNLECFEGTALKADAGMAHSMMESILKE